jgi:hypothetical protein
MLLKKLRSAAEPRLMLRRNINLPYLPARRLRMLAYPFPSPSLHEKIDEPIRMKDGKLYSWVG